MTIELRWCCAECNDVYAEDPGACRSCGSAEVYPHRADDGARL